MPASLPANAFRAAIGALAAAIRGCAARVAVVAAFTVPLAGALRPAQAAAVGVDVARFAVESGAAATRAASLAFAALADPVRLKLLSLIAAAGELCSCDMVEPLGKSQPTVSHHTKILAEAGLITGDKRGRWVYWSVPVDRADFVRNALTET